MARRPAAGPMRRCIGSERFGIAAHEAPPADFPAQPSQKDGLGRMCAVHWKAYVRALGAARRSAPAPAAPAPAAPRASRQQRRAAAQAAGKVPDADGEVRGPVAGPESPSATRRRAAFEARVARAGAGTDEGQRILEAGGGGGQSPDPEDRADPADPDNTAGSIDLAGDEA